MEKPSPSPETVMGKNGMAWSGTESNGDIHLFVEMKKKV